MRISRAYIAGAGTTSLLVGSAVLLLAVVSTLVAFKDWGSGPGENISSVVVNEPERLPVEAPPQIARAAPAAAEAVASVPAPGSAAAGTPASPRTAPVGASAAASGLGGARGGVGRLRDAPPPPAVAELPPVGGGSTGLLPETLLSGEVERLTAGVGQTTLGLTDELGDTVSLVNPALGGVLTNTGKTLAELLQELGRPGL